MAITATSFTPSTGPTTGGTTVTITGTGLDTAVAVLVNNINAVIVSQAPTSLVIKTPAKLATGANSIRVLDATTDTVVSGSFTAAVPSTAETLVSTSARKWRCDVNTGTYASPVWTKIRAVTSFVPAVNTATTDDSDYDSGVWGSDAKTQLKWSLAITISRKVGTISGAYDPGQEALRAAHDQVGAAGAVDVRWYDRTGGPEAYRGTAIVDYAPTGGAPTALDEATITLTGQGARTPLSPNPVLADATLQA